MHEAADGETRPLDARELAFQQNAVAFVHQVLGQIDPILALELRGEAVPLDAAYGGLGQGQRLELLEALLLEILPGLHGEQADLLGGRIFEYYDRYGLSLTHETRLRVTALNGSREAKGMRAAGYEPHRVDVLHASVGLNDDQTRQLRWDTLKSIVESEWSSSKLPLVEGLAASLLSLRTQGSIECRSTLVEYLDTQIGYMEDGLTVLLKHVRGLDPQETFPQEQCRTMSGKLAELYRANAALLRSFAGIPNVRPESFPVRGTRARLKQMISVLGVTPESPSSPAVQLATERRLLAFGNLSRLSDDPIGDAYRYLGSSNDSAPEGVRAQCTASRQHPLEFLYWNEVIPVLAGYNERLEEALLMSLLGVSPDDGQDGQYRELLYSASLRMPLGDQSSQLRGWILKSWAGNDSPIAWRVRRMAEHDISRLEGNALHHLREPLAEGLVESLAEIRDPRAQDLRERWFYDTSGSCSAVSLLRSISTLPTAALRASGNSRVISST